MSVSLSPIVDALRQAKRWYENVEENSMHAANAVASRMCGRVGGPYIQKADERPRRITKFRNDHETNTDEPRTNTKEDRLFWGYTLEIDLNFAPADLPFKFTFMVFVRVLDDTMTIKARYSGEHGDEFETEKQTPCARRGSLLTEEQQEATDEVQQNVINHIAASIPDRIDLMIKQQRAQGGADRGFMTHF